MIAGKELVERRLQGVFLGVAGILLLIILFTLGTSFTLLGVFLCYEVLTYLRPCMFWYFIPLGFAFVSGETDSSVQFIIAVLIGLFIASMIL